MVLSATMTQDPSKLIQLHLHHPLLIREEPDTLPEKLECLRLICESEIKAVYLVALLKSCQREKCIVFASSAKTVLSLCMLLNNFYQDLNIQVKEYSSGLDQRTRRNNLNAFKSGKIQVLVASDGLARGMDIKGVTIVINYDIIPLRRQSFIHRAGRTARAGQAGRCFTLLCDEEVRRFSTDILKKLGVDSCTTIKFPSATLDPIRVTYDYALPIALKMAKEEKAARKRKQAFKDNSRTKNKSKTKPLRKEMIGLQPCNSTRRIPKVTGPRKDVRSNESSPRTWEQTSNVRRISEDCI